MWNTIVAELSPKSGPDTVVMLMRLFGAALLCGIIGFERELKTRTAGLRTNMLVGIASTAFALITLSVMEMPLLDQDIVRVDPIRLVEAVTNGVAFLAAGIVVFSKGQVHGLTTGASMWLSAGIGLAVGLGFWFIAVVAAATGFIVLDMLRKLQTSLGIKDESETQVDA
ncbi:putative Mg2+ transporter-C (MgtC) family protein [Sulfitobacter brevis]|uniref:Protein MgtC n=1 Tax=Sulfitobacter brevis TaxID=74348 RepID=A0A1I2DXG5_9RHOB|nr:MgtC/SapB family protein [Sulfitobacter brevis]SFE84640.1 putative Mg2+ transporter-C (MgtC) family protein [Sulfitobacter brevis]